MSIDGNVNIGDPNNYGVGYVATPWTVAGEFVVGRTADGDAVLPEWDLSTLLEDITPLTELGPYTLSATALNGSANMGDVNVPLYDTNGVMLGGTVSNGDATLPQYDAAGDTGAEGSLQAPTYTLAAAGLTGQVATGESALASPTLSAALLQNGFGNGDIALAMPDVAATGFGGGVATGALVLLEPTLSAAAALSAAVAGSITVPLYTLSADGFMDAPAGTASVILPGFTLDAQGGAVVAAPVFTSLALNTRTKAMTTYSNNPFNSLCSFNGVVLAASSSGVVALTGADDNGTAIAASLTVGVSDFGGAQLKRVLAGYAGYRADGDLQLTLITDDATEYTYTLAPRQATAIHPTRVVFGRGVRSRYWQWRLANVAGADFKLDDLSFDVDPQTRRV